MRMLTHGKGHERFDPANIYEAGNEAGCNFRGCAEDAVHDGADSYLFCSRHLMKINRKVGLKEGVLEAVVPMQLAGEDMPDVKSSGVVYFMLKGDLVKIGFSTNLRQRAKDLKVDRVLAYFPGDMSAERTAHEAFAQWHSHGEWFHATPECLAYIQRLTARAA